MTVGIITMVGCADDSDEVGVRSDVGMQEPEGDTLPLPNAVRVTLVTSPALREVADTPARMPELERAKKKPAEIDPPEMR